MAAKRHNFVVLVAHITHVAAATTVLVAMNLKQPAAVVSHTTTAAETAAQHPLWAWAAWRCLCCDMAPLALCKVIANGCSDALEFRVTVTATAMGTP